MKYIIQFLKSIIAELCIICIYVFLINSYIGNVEKTIKSDAIGYYDYLPSLFIHHDLIRKDISIKKDSIHFSRIRSLSVYIDYDTFKVNKFPCGTAILQLPFFVCTYLITENEGNEYDGYQTPYQKAVFYASLFYLFLSIFFLKKILSLYEIKKSVIFLSQLLLVLATNITNYTNVDAGFSHVYSLFAITAFIYFTKLYFMNKKLNYFIYACLFFGLIIILRQINVLIILFVPFLAGSLSELKNGLTHLFNNPKKPVFGIFLVFLIFSIQSILWYLQTGHLLIYSYQGESFNFFKPEFYNILFSYKKGLFIYTPILLITMLGLIWLVYKKKYYLFFTWLLFFIFLTYVLSSWWCWFYGSSYGLRAYIDFFAIFFIIFAIMLNEINIKMKLMLSIASIITIPINIIQTYQYKEFILDWVNMDKDKYWKVFLKTEDKYKGLLWKKTYDYSNYNILCDTVILDIQTKKNTNQIIYKINSNTIQNFDDLRLVKIEFENEFKEDNNSELELSIDIINKPKVVTPYHTYLIQFADRPFNNKHIGNYNFDINTQTNSNDKTITIEVNSGNENDHLHNFHIVFFSLKNKF